MERDSAVAVLARRGLALLVALEDLAAGITTNNTGEEEYVARMGMQDGVVI